MAVVHALLGALAGALLVLGGDAALRPETAHASASVLPRVPRATIDGLPVHLDLDDSRKQPGLGSRAPYTLHFGVTLWNVHTRELLPIELEGRPDPQAVADFLRCRVTQNTHAMAEAPLSVALTIAASHEARLVHVISGFRSPKLNEILRKKGHEVARNSRHTRGQALDFRVPGVGAREMATAATELHAGGIGTYPVSGFIHVDVGPPRSWSGQ